MWEIIFVVGGIYGGYKLVKYMILQEKYGADLKGYNKYGRNMEGYDRDGFHANGFNRRGRDRSGFDANGFDANGYDKEYFKTDGFNNQGWNKQKINQVTSTKFDVDGFDIDGWNKDKKCRDYTSWYAGKRDRAQTYNSHGFDYYGYDYKGIHKDTGTLFNNEGYNAKGFDLNGKDKDGHTEEYYRKQKSEEKAKQEKNKKVAAEKVKQEKIEEAKQQQDSLRSHNTKLLNEYDEIIFDTNVFMKEKYDKIFNFIMRYNKIIIITKDVYDELVNIKEKNKYGTPKAMGARTGISRISKLGDLDLVKWEKLEVQAQKSYADPMLIKLFENNNKNRLLVSDDNDVINRARAFKQHSDNPEKGHVMRAETLLSLIK